MPQKDRKGAPKASAIMKNSKAGFDTYDDSFSTVPADSVTVVKKGSPAGKIAKKAFNEIMDIPGEYKGKDVRKSTASMVAGARVDRFAKSKDHKFFKHTQKDNK